jgi:hypothetical protein
MKHAAWMDPEPRASSDHAIGAILDGLDEIATTMERTWGVGRLRRLVGDDLRAKFDAQKDKLDAAIVTNQLHYIRAQADGMRRAWTALDKAANEAGHRPLSPEVWECILPGSGEVVAIVRSEAEAHHVCRDVRAFAIAEIGHLIEVLGPTVLEAKRVFPGEKLGAIRTSAVKEVPGDEIPF